MHTRVLRTAAALLVACAAIGAAACSGQQDNEPAVATPSLTFSKDRVPIGSAVTLTYKFAVAADAKFDKDYWIFVHVLDTDNEQMWTDDHLPPTPTSQWKPGQTIEYKRTVFVPNYPYIGEAVVRLGMYDRDTNRRLVLNAPEASRREYVVARFQVLGSNENIFTMPESGWHPTEVDAKNPQNEWQWSQRTSVTRFRNPRRAVTLYIQYDARPDLFPAPQQVVLKIRDQVIGQFTADSKAPALKTFDLSPEQLGTGDMVDLVFEVDKTFKPGGADPRELGIRVFHVYIEPK